MAIARGPEPLHAVRACGAGMGGPPGCGLSAQSAAPHHAANFLLLEEGLMSVQRGFWLAVACGALILTLATGLRATFGLFLKPVSLDLGISREYFGLGFALQNLLWGLASPFLGSIADKYGTG